MHLVRHKKQPKKTVLDYLIYFFCFTTPLFELPQAYLIYTHHSAEGVSFITWVYFSVTSVVWLAYGVRQRLIPIIIAYTLYLLAELSVVIGILLYG